MPSKREVPAENLAALARYNAANGYSDDPKVTKLKAPRARAEKLAPPPRRKKLNAQEYRDEIIAMYKLQHLKKAEYLPAYDVTSPTRYPGVALSTKLGDVRLAAMLKRYEWVMKPQGVTPEAFKFWRVNMMYMTPEQLGAFVRVNERTVRNWENGTSEIPFSMWWVMHSTLQDPECFLTRPGFHDFYIDYDHDRQQPVLCSYTWPDIRCSPTDLYISRSALGSVSQLQSQVAQKEREITRLTAENTKLRQMMKSGTVAAELTAMQAHIGKLLASMHTADVVEFPQQSPAAAGGEVRQFAAA